MVRRLTTPPYNAISRQSISTFSCKGSAIIRAQIIFTTRKLKTCLSTLETSFARELRPTYVGQKVRHLATRVDEHHKGDTPVGQHLLECNK